MILVTETVIHVYMVWMKHSMICILQSIITTWLYEQT
jgi:hypothetical protein